MATKKKPAGAPGAARSTPRRTVKDPFADRWKYTPEERARILADPEAAFREERATATYQARERLAQYLQDAHLDPVILRSPEHVKFVWLMRETLLASHHTQAVDWMLKPIDTLLSRRGGGRPSTEEKWGEWRDRVDELKRTKPTLTARERYEDVAAEWAKGNESIKWSAIRDGISDLKKREKNPV
jgi:hypothetical protein